MKLLRTHCGVNYIRVACLIGSSSGLKDGWGAFCGILLFFSVDFIISLNLAWFSFHNRQGDFAPGKSSSASLKAWRVDGHAWHEMLVQLAYFLPLSFS